MSALAVLPLPNVASKPSEGDASQDSPKRNKRKSHEPKKVPTESSGVARKIKFSPTENNGETSDGEERNQSMGSASPDSCGSEGQAIHPKKRFKQDPAFMDFSSSPPSAASTRSLPLLIPLPQSPTAPSSHCPRNNNNNNVSGKIHRPWDSAEKSSTPEPATTAPSVNSLRDSQSGATQAALATLLTQADPAYLQALILAQYQALATQAYQAQALAAVASSAGVAPAGPAEESPAISTPPKSSSPEPEQEEPLALIKKPAALERTADAPTAKSLSPPAKWRRGGDGGSGKKWRWQTPEQGLSSLSKGQKTAKSKSPAKTPSPPGAGSRNYKNMTRERRVEANARERQRVHTITAAYDKLHYLIPSPENATKPLDGSLDGLETQVKDVLFKTTTEQAANNQCKLSKLSIIKIATSYITLLSRMAGHDYSEDKSAPSIQECIENTSRLLSSETKSSKKKD